MLPSYTDPGIALQQPLTVLPPNSVDPVSLYDYTHAEPAAIMGSPPTSPAPESNSGRSGGSNTPVLGIRYLSSHSVHQRDQLGACVPARQLVGPNQLVPSQNQAAVLADTPAQRVSMSQSPDTLSEREVQEQTSYSVEGIAVDNRHTADTRGHLAPLGVSTPLAGQASTWRPERNPENQRVAHQEAEADVLTAQQHQALLNQQATELQSRLEAEREMSSDGNPDAGQTGRPCSSASTISQCCRVQGVPRTTACSTAERPATSRSGTGRDEGTTGTDSTTDKHGHARCGYH